MQGLGPASAPADAALVMVLANATVFIAILGVLFWLAVRSSSLRQILAMHHFGGRFVIVSGSVLIPIETVLASMKLLDFHMPLWKGAALLLCFFLCLFFAVGLNVNILLHFFTLSLIRRSQPDSISTRHEVDAAKKIWHKWRYLHALLPGGKNLIQIADRKHVL